ncbi:YybS family protein [Thalassobacillus sp. CUG 92003]|uniref:YybS family protein n=1 Tax=Thalassobacillus sp. CUG 92003 TaxID=2736641 RepID=UPI0015E7C96D|nr:YybS family protein [Thalassobacillus sp. CUG 92003]
MNDSRRITEGALMAGLYLLLLLVHIFLPFIGAFVLIALPVPFIVYTYKHGWKPGAIVFIASIILSSLMATIYSIPVTILMGLGGMFTGWAMHQKRNAYETWAAGSIGFIIGLVIVFASSQLLFNVSWTETVQTTIDQALRNAETMLNNFGGGASEEQLALLEEQVSSWPDLIPSMLAFVGIGLAFIGQWLSYKMINRLEQTKLSFPAFRDFRLPLSLLWYYFFALILDLVITDTDSIWNLAAINLFTLTGSLILLQGFAFIFYYAHIKGKSKALPITAVVLSFLFPMILLYLVRILGIIDIGFSLRERLNGNKK